MRHPSNDREAKGVCLVTRIGVLVAGLVLWTGTIAGAARLELFVATNGNDAWSGRLAAPNAEGTDGPLATLECARALIRKQKDSAGLPEGAVVQVRGGLYYMPRPLRLVPGDSGAEGAPIVYRAYRDEKVTLSGGRPITGFTSHKGNILKADVAKLGLKGFAFRQLFFNGKRQHLARYPNFEPDAPVCGGWAFVAGEPVRMYKDIPDEHRRTLVADPKDIHQWARPEEGEVFIFPRYNWWNNILPIASVDAAKHTITTAKDASFGMRPGDRYYARNLFEELDAPGEWYLDTRTATLYFWPPASIEGATITAPVMKNVFSLWKASHITIHGFTIECTEESPIAAWDSQHCTFAGNTIRHAVGHSSSSMAAIRINGRNNTAFGNDIYDVGGRGINLGGGNRETLAPGNNVAENNYIHHTGVLWKAGVAIRVDGVGNRASRNLIHDTPRGGISWNGSDHIIELNHIRHTNTQISDTAGINACNGSWVKRGTVIRYNYIHDTLGFGKNHRNEWVSPYYCWGIYLDNFTCGTHVHGNICARIVLGGPFIHGGRDNLIENNIIIDCGTAQMYYSSWKPKTEKAAQGIRDELAKYGKLPAYQKYPGLPEMFQSTYDEWLQMAGNKFFRNILSFTDPKAAVYSVRELPFDKTQSDYNLIHHVGHPLLIRGLKGVAPEKQWDAWKAHGFEAHSLLADPLFVDPKKDDFRLRPESPALKLGFKPIPFDKIGCYSHPLRASWPIVEAEGVREHPLKLDRMPRPPKPSPRGPRPTFRVPRLKTPIQVDGTVAEAEWSQVNMRRGITLGQDVRGDKAKPVSYAWLTWDDAAFYVAFRNYVNPAKPLKTEAVWNTNDAIEVAVRNPSVGQGAPIFVLRGYPKGQHESSTEAGAPAGLAEALGQEVRYGARIVGKPEWTAEWRIPFAALGVKPVKGLKLDLNLTVRKTASNLWLMWRGTRGCSWQVGEAGIVILD